MASLAGSGNGEDNSAPMNLADDAVLSHDGHISEGSDFLQDGADKWGSEGNSQQKIGTKHDDLKTTEHSAHGSLAETESIEGVHSANRTDTKSSSLDQLGNLTLREIGENESSLPCLSIAASKPRAEWITDLETLGYAGLLFVSTASVKDQPGFEISWWYRNRKDVRRRLVRTPLETAATAGIFTALKPLPSASAINAVICTVAELVSSGKKTIYGASTVQLFVPSQGGFSQDFRADSLENEEEHDRYRCFSYLGPDSEEDTENATVAVGREGVFIGSAGDNTRVFGADTVLTLAAYYGEADRKFCLHPGDILVMNSKYPFAVDLPIGGRAKGARIISWKIFPVQDDVSLPKVMPSPEIMMNIEQVIANNQEAREFYTAEFDSFEINPGSIGDPEGYMQRFRVTPGKYTPQEVLDELENNDSILYVNGEYFNA